MKVSEEFPSKYLKASDLNGSQPTLKIESVLKEEVGRDNQQKMVTYFEGRQKGLVLNKTNSNTLTYKFGDDTDEWIGKSVQLYSEPVYFQGKTTDGLRVRPAAVRPAAPMKQELNDETPF
jgi:hypothetical protein